MLKIIISDKDYKVPTSWKDITYDRYCEIINFVGTDPIEFISVVSGIPCSTLKNTDVESIGIMTNLFTFVSDVSLLHAFSSYKDGLKIGKQSWHKLERAKNEIKRHKHYLCSAKGIIKIYLDKDIGSESIIKVWGEVNYYLKEINLFFEKYKRLSESDEEDPDEFMAGVKRFEQFGFFAQCVELSRKMGKTYDEVLSMSASQIYETFLYDFEKSDYEKKLYKLKSKQ